MTEKLFPTSDKAIIRPLASDKVEVKFSKGDFIRCGRNEFKDKDDLLSYLSETFPLTPYKDGFCVSVRQAGKYQRLDPEGNPVFTFGDPILDLITDEQGWLVIGGEKHNLKAAELREPHQRYGGIHKIDLQPYLEDIKRAQVIEAVLGGGRFTLVGCSGRELIVASRNPSEQWFHKNGASMRFRAWKKSYGVYWSIGAEIETWGADFESASIESQYGELIDRSYDNYFF